MSYEAIEVIGGSFEWSIEKQDVILHRGTFEKQDEILVRLLLSFLWTESVSVCFLLILCVQPSVCC